MKEKNDTICLNVTIHNAQRLLKWGTYGKYGNEPLTYKRLIDCSSDHLKNIIETQSHCPDYYIIVIKSILSDRDYDISDIL